MTAAGDLTTAFNFTSPNDAIVALPSTALYQPPNQNRYPDYVPAVPASQTLPTQEPGLRPARALPYNLNVDGELNFSAGGVELTFRNAGQAGAAFQVRFADGKTLPRTYTVAAGDEVSDVFGATGATSYDLAVFGPNGFRRTFAGGLRPGSANLSVRSILDKSGASITLHIQNQGSIAEKISIRDSYTGKSQTRMLHPGNTGTFENSLHPTFGWYDLTVTAQSDSSFARQLAGHLENGRPSMSDPAIGAR